ncbi:MAG: hypothetical protein ACK41Q_07530 [Candidatus Brocadia sp.]
MKVSPKAKAAILWSCLASGMLQMTFVEKAKYHVAFARSPWLEQARCWCIHCNQLFDAYILGALDYGKYFCFSSGDMSHILSLFRTKKSNPVSFKSLASLPFKASSVVLDNDTDHVQQRQTAA